MNNLVRAITALEVMARGEPDWKGWTEVLGICHNISNLRSGKSDKCEWREYCERYLNERIKAIYHEWPLAYNKTTLYPVGGKDEYTGNYNLWIGENGEKRKQLAQYLADELGKEL